jgi:hypothetical protein
VKALSSNPKTARKMEKRGQGGEGRGREKRRGEERRKEKKSGERNRRIDPRTQKTQIR